MENDPYCTAFDLDLLATCIPPGPHCSRCRQNVLALFPYSPNVLVDSESLESAVGERAAHLCRK